MNIGIDITQIQYKRTGVARFTGGFLNAIMSFGQSHSWHIYYHSHGTPLSSLGYRSFPKHVSVYEVSIPERIERFVAYDIPALSPLLKRYLYPNADSLDWFVSSDWIEPLLPSKQATIVHDLVVYQYPETVDRIVLQTQKKRLDRVTKHANLIFVDSMQTKKDVKQYFPQYSRPLIVNYPGVTPPSSQYSSSEPIPFNLKRPYILAVGKQEPRKNYERLIEAWKPLRQLVDLVIVGQPGWGSPVSSTDERFHLLQSVDDDSLWQLNRHAQAFVFVSLYEGFGYPLIEALSFGIPSLVTKDSSLSEIGGAAVLVCDAHKTIDITSQLSEILTNPELRKRLSEKGKQIATTFTWKSYYDKVIQSLSIYSPT